ncbi:MULTISPECIES: hypothetical protein [unclassified Clostridioides]|nr:hypothetical protein [Clostridioides sp. ZZV15-6388]MCC0645150.1 hypothetical protein [Clostridioides sp. ZZV14-6150]MCC0661244.1 hypothetical protein [Clostridioides sp. ZZV14-6154]MCC0663158.1 hypothetical protein [Clostridioides sp. ZZV15-6597]MCC0719492.1 hypothetical protein [Clostridioides sp. ZZV14-6105]MCC0723119.1 hypothetical protein [Clostridioides sp. ZZV14-6104]WLD26911.1 hypothetical protein CDIFMA2_07830 [Clostridioides difficile]
MNKSRNFKEEIEERAKKEEARRKDSGFIIMLKKNGFKLEDTLTKFKYSTLTENEIKEVY